MSSRPMSAVPACSATTLVPGCCEAGMQSSDQRACFSLHGLQFTSAHAPTYGYESIYRTAPYAFPKMPGFQPLAAHMIDVRFR
jgi:hypothetical protein